VPHQRSGSGGVPFGWVSARLTDGVERRLDRGVCTWELLFVLFGGALFGFVVLFADYLRWDQCHRTFAGNGAFVLWAGLMCAQTALWALALAFLLPSVTRLRARYFARNRTEVVGSTWMIMAIILVVAVGLPIKSSWPDYVPHHAVKIGLLTIVGLFVGLVAARGIWFVHGGLKQLAGENLGTDQALRTFLALQSDLHRFLGTLGAILGLIILSTSAQRRVVLAYAADTQYGYELVLVYGFFFSILVAATYLPTHLTLIRVGQRIRDTLFPAVPANSPEWLDRTTKREQLGSMLELQTGPLGRFKASAAILTPFVGSLIGLLLK
jgi:hypothetical protein